jgi:hypothetical protein
MPTEHAPASRNKQAIARQQRLLTFHATIEELLKAGFSVLSRLMLYNEDEQGKLVSCEPVAIQQGHEYGSRGISIVGRHYQAMTSEDYNRLRLSMFCSDL